MPSELKEKRLTGTMTAKEIASAINRHLETVLRWARDGLIPARKRNSRVILFDGEQVELAMEHNGLKRGS